MWQVYLGDTVSQDPEHMQALAAMDPPHTVGELTQTMQATNLMPTSLPQLVVVIKPLQDMLEEYVRDARRTRHGADRRVVADVD